MLQACFGHSGKSAWLWMATGVVDGGGKRMVPAEAASEIPGEDVVDLDADRDFASRIEVFRESACVHIG
jgi:hypothetical protein